jgi:hypothetical protein
MTVAEIVAGSADAMGGEHNIDALRTLRFRLSSPNGLEPMLWEIVRPNLVRKERPGKLVLVFDGYRAAFLQAPPDDDGTPGEPHVIDREDWHHFEMDIALHVPAYFEYPATYEDTSTVRGSLAHLLRVQLPMGGVVVYAVDAESLLPTKIVLPAWEYERYVGDYRKVDGFTYFHKYWSGEDEADTTLIEELGLNTNIDHTRFTIPASIR